ncbi:MAG: methylenetetrahydrofolate reductase [NAD(P)H] [Proteobacteria bacterium]|nr:methylenetetrahydrofolate reductase [NAD(P)H] [Pseudomonadota bacterium]MDE3207471.1 methylenetetrahydrofolate reductase [NAD(P)H] [Pseudomonadota bacterium]
MDIRPIQQRKYSFEFFPPKTDEGVARLHATTQQLGQLAPHFFSVTYGAGGSTQDRTLETVLAIQKMGYAAAPHLSCIGATRFNVRQTLQKYSQHKIRHMVALRGDLPSGMVASGEFRFASELVTFIRQELGDSISIEVAAYPEYHPQCGSAQQDLLHFKNKIEAGANSAITQYFYNADAYFRFIDDCAAMGIHIPIVPGIMPINNYFQLARFSEICGAEIPRWIRLRLEGYRDDLPSIRAFGLDIVTELCDRLLHHGAPGLHFYTLNQAGPSSTIWQRLGIQS